MARPGMVQRFRRKWQLRSQRNFQQDVWGEIGRGLVGQLYVDLGGGPEDAVFMAGHGRSGTTWIAEVANHANEYRYIHEPFHPGRLAATDVFRPRQYLRPGTRDPRYVRPAERILSGEIRSLWGDKYNRAHLPRKRLIKEVRGNLLLPWLHATFPEMPIVLLLRHPCAVVHSQAKLAESWRVDLDRFLGQPDLMEDYLGPFQERIASPGSDFEKRILVWCIDNLVPLRYFHRGDLYVAFYENFCVDPATEIKELFSFLGQRYDEKALAHLTRPSATSRRDSAIVSGEDLVNSWRKGVSEEQISAAVDSLSVFGLDAVYGEASMPKLRYASDALQLG